MMSVLCVKQSLSPLVPAVTVLSITLLNPAVAQQASPPGSAAEKAGEQRPGDAAKLRDRGIDAGAGDRDMALHLQVARQPSLEQPEAVAVAEIAAGAPRPP